MLFECCFCGLRNTRMVYCSQCNRNFTALFGKQWQKLDWATEMINIYGLNMMEAEKRNTVDISTTDVAAGLDGRVESRPIYIIPDLTGGKIITYDTKIRDLMRMGLGARVIHRALVNQYGNKAPSLATVQRRMRLYR